MNILIADTLDIYRFGLKMLVHTTLTAATVYEVNNFEEMVQALTKKKFDLLLVDIEMPGNEQLERFIINKPYPDLKIVILSEQGITSQRVNFLLKIGAHESISKTASNIQLINMLAFHLFHS